MLKFFAKRIGDLLFTMLVVSFLIFLTFEFSPADRRAKPRSASIATKAAARASIASRARSRSVGSSTATSRGSASSPIAMAS